MKERILIGLACLLCLTACGPKKTTESKAEPRAFPAAVIPIMLEDPNQRISWLVQHYWDPFTAPDSLYFSDSLHINGVPFGEVEEQMGVFATMLQQVTPEDGGKAMENLFGRMDGFQEAHPSANLFDKLNALVSKYFYDPNSPVRSELLYLSYVKRLAGSGRVSATDRKRYEWEAETCALNLPGTPAADFSFIDTEGRRHTLYGIDADLTLLIFGNPDCRACQEIQQSIAAVEALSKAIKSGRLKVVDIYIDKDISRWKANIPDYPKDWINGYDPDFTIRTDLLYNVRALPSLYLLDKDKTVLLKDCTPEQFFRAMGV